MPTIVDYAVAAADVLTDDFELPVANVEVHPVSWRGGLYPTAVDIQVVGLDEVTRWAIARSATLILTKVRGHVDVTALFVHHDVATRAWGHIEQDEARDLFDKLGRSWGAATSIELDPTQVLAALNQAVVSA